MKNGLFNTFACCIVFLLLAHTSRAQERYNLAGGFGTPEMLNVGVRVQFDQIQLGINAGTNPVYKNDNFSVSGDFYYHFGGRSVHTRLPPWYVKSGLTYMTSEGNWEKRMNLILVPRLGRELNLSPEFGIALEAGIMILLIDSNTPKKERTEGVSGDLDLIGSGVLMPSAGLKIFYRLL